MHRRARHLNARDAGATMVLDARFISGSDGDAIGTWASRTSSTYDMTQSTASYKPLLKLGANGINGQAAVLFDGTNDRLSGANEDINTCSCFAVAYNTNSGTIRNIFGRSKTSDYTRNFILTTNTGSNTLFTNRSDGTNFPVAQSTDFTTGSHVANGYYDGTNLGIRIDGKSYTTTAGVSSTGGANWDVGWMNDGPSGPNYHWNDRISAVVLFKNSVASSSIAKRVEHSLAYSFKIACS